MNHDELIQFVSNAFDKAKYGSASEVYCRIIPYFDKGDLPLKSHYAFGWIIYYALHQSPANEITARKQMLAKYLRLSLQVPHKLHSMVLTEAIRLYKNARELAYNSKDDGIARFSIVKFMKLWNLQNLRPGDWNRKEHEGKKLSSTVEKLITLYVDDLESNPTNPPEEFVTVIDKALACYPDSYNLLCQRASVCVLAGETAEAMALLRKALLAAPGKFYIWSKLANLIPAGTNPHLHVALLYKALSSTGPDRFKGKIRLSLADALASKGAFPQALHELQHVKDVYEQNGWHLPGTFNGIFKKIPSGTVAENPERIYRKVEHLADEEIYSCLPYLEVTKTYHKNPSEHERKRHFGKPCVAWRITDKEGTSYWLTPQRFGINENLPIGTPLAIRIHNGKPVYARLI